MKRIVIALLGVSLLAGGCGTTQPERTGAIVGGAAIGSNVGGAIGGLVGDSRHGWRGSYRGSAIGSIIGTLAGAAIGGALTAPKSREAEGNPQGYPAERPVEEVYTEPYNNSSALSTLYIRNLRFIDDSRDHILNGGENSKIIFEIMNEGSETAYNVIPSVTEISGTKQIHISPSILVEQILPGNGVKYTATVSEERHGHLPHCGDRHPRTNLRPPGIYLGDGTLTFPNQSSELDHNGKRTIVM